MNKYAFKFLFLVSFFVCISNAKAYVINRTGADSLVHWPSNVSSIDIYLNPSNTLGVSENTVHTIVSNSVAEWNGKSRITLRKNSTSGANQDGVNEIFFSNDPNIFNGSGVVGVTQVLFKNGNGEILEADVLINNIFI